MHNKCMDIISILGNVLQEEVDSNEQDRISKERIGFRECIQVTRGKDRIRRERTSRTADLKCFYASSRETLGIRRMSSVIQWRKI